MMENFTSKLSMITSLDVSYCLQIGPQALETIGKNCKLLEVLRRNMHPIDTFDKPFVDDEALAIALNMPKLKHLEMTYHLMTNTGILKILSSCHDLQHLDLRGCWGVIIRDICVNENYPSIQILGPHVDDIYRNGDFEEGSDASDILEFLHFDFGLEDWAEFFVVQLQGEENWVFYDDGEIQGDVRFGVNGGPGDFGVDEPPPSP